MRANTLRWELIGIPLIFLSGSALHFAFEWSGRMPLVAPFAAVNESVWEHLKMAFWPAAAYALAEYCFFGRNTANFVPAKAAGIILMPLLIALGFYGYTAVVGHHLLWLDIMLFLVAICAGQLTGHLIMTAEPLPRQWRAIGLACLALLAFAFAVFSFRPPRLPMFRDSVTGAYGVRS